MIESKIVIIFLRITEEKFRVCSPPELWFELNQDSTVYHSIFLVLTFPRYLIAFIVERAREYNPL